ncbi:MAG: SDR family oxidoreductase [Cyclobacteriaceae bacterium]
MQNYLIIGASSGIGFQIVKSLVDQGDRVIAVARNQRGLSNLDNVRFMSYNVLSEDGFELGEESLDGFVYCPGTINLKPFQRIKPEDFRKDFEVNVIGGVRILQSVLPFLKKADNPSAVFFSTVAVQQGMGFHSSIAASKGAIEGLTRSLAAELAPQIRVNCLAPSVTDTPLAERLLSTIDKKEVSGKRHPLHRVGTPEDLANAALFLLSEKSSWITGQIIGVDGGMSSLRTL